MSEQANNTTGKESESLAELVARVRRSGCDTADLERLLDATAELARQRTAEKVRKRRWRILSKRAGGREDRAGDQINGARTAAAKGTNKHAAKTSTTAFAPVPNLERLFVISVPTASKRGTLALDAMPAEHADLLEPKKERPYAKLLSLAS
jgi:hypothetical protein